MVNFYELRMLNVFERLNISNQGRIMLKAFDDFKTSRIDKAELGRLIRLSPSNRSSLINTILQCAEMMNQDSSQSKHCTIVIKSCSEMIKIADERPEQIGFPFLKLPIEVRRNVYEFYCVADRLSYSEWDRSRVLICCQKKSRCKCAPYEEKHLINPPSGRLALARTCSRIRDEVLPVFYQSYTLYFSCACNMGSHLRQNKILRQSVRNIQFHWCGPSADKGISQLQKTRLNSLTVIISKETVMNLTHREELFRPYFIPKRSYETCLTDALGIDELIMLRGIPMVRVDHIGKASSYRLSASSKNSLKNLLEDTMTQDQLEDEDDE
ncbi:hypothetical protein AAE478_002971 [Parahypoxylon ruwenzoriense]